MSEIVREDLVRIHTCLFAKLFHHAPDITSIQWPSASGAEHRAFFDIFLPAVFHQALAQFFCEIDQPAFSFAGYLGFSLGYRLRRDICQFTDADTGSGNGFYS